MTNFPPIHESESVPEGVAFLIPAVPVTVFFPAKQIAPTIEQELAAIVNAYLAAARAGKIGVIRCQ